MTKSNSAYFSYFVWAILLFVSSIFTVQAQTYPGAVTSNPSQVEIIKADSLIGLNQPFMQMKKLIGNVGLRQEYRRGLSRVFPKIAAVKINVQ